MDLNPILICLVLKIHLNIINPRVDRNEKHVTTKLYQIQ